MDQCTCRTTRRERFEDPNCPIHGIAEQRRRHEQARRKTSVPVRRFPQKAIALAAVLLAGCATNPRAEMAARLQSQCFREHMATVEAIGVRNSVPIHQACARWAWDQANQIPR